MKTVIMMVFGLLGLSGCATLNDLSRTNADELLPLPTKQVQHADYGVPEGFDCGKSPKAWPKTTPSDVQLFERSRYCAMIEDDNSLVEDEDDDKKRQVTPPRKHLARFVRHGMELADAHCEVFLDALEGKRVLTEFNLSTFNTLVGAATIAMAKLGNHPQSLFNLATGAAAANSFADNYKANFLLTGTLFQLREAVKQYRNAMLEAPANLSNPTGYTSYVSAQSDLREYASVCSHKGLVHLVNAKLADTKFESNSLDKTAGDRLVRKVLDDAKTINKSITKTVFASGEFETIYELVRLEKSTRIALMKKMYEAEKKLLKAHFAGLWEVIVALGLDTETPIDAEDIGLAGRLLGYPQGASLNQRDKIAGLVKTHVSQDAASAAAQLSGNSTSSASESGKSAKKMVIRVTSKRESAQ